MIIFSYSLDWMVWGIRRNIFIVGYCSFNFIDCCNKKKCVKVKGRKYIEEWNKGLCYIFFM